jgi:hypothetical protein
MLLAAAGSFEAQCRSSRSVAWDIPSQRVPAQLRPKTEGEMRQKLAAVREIRSVRFIPNAVPADDLSPALRPHEVADLPTRDLLEMVVKSGYEGHPWEELARRLVVRALPDLERSIRTGSIYQRCRRAKLGIPQRQELQRPPLAQGIAAEAVEDCLERFKVQVLPAGEWDPDRGATLENFFTSCCLSHVANRWPWHLHTAPGYPARPLEHSLLCRRGGTAKCCGQPNI